MTPLEQLIHDKYTGRFGHRTELKIDYQSFFILPDYPDREAKEGVAWMRKRLAVALARMVRVCIHTMQKQQEEVGTVDINDLTIGQAKALSEQSAELVKMVEEKLTRGNVLSVSTTMD